MVWGDGRWKWGGWSGKIPNLLNLGKIWMGVYSKIAQIYCSFVGGTVLPVFSIFNSLKEF